MGVRIIRELVCDLCGDGEGVRRWRVTDTDTNKTVSPDLCKACSKPFQAVFDKLPAGKRGQTRKRPVVTEADVRRARRAAQKKPAK